MSVDEPAAIRGWFVLPTGLPGIVAPIPVEATAMAEAVPVTPASPLVVTFPEEIDATNAGQVRQRLSTALATGAPVVIADMTLTEFCDSMGLGALAMTHKQAAASGAELRVVVASEEVLRIMGITQLTTVLHLYPTLDAALSNDTPIQD